MDQPVSVPPISASPSATPAPPKKSYKWLIISIIAFLLASASVFGYKYYQVKQQVAQPQASPAISPSPSVAAVIAPDDPFAGWLTYTNSVHHLSFKYPDTWQIDKTSDSEAINAALTLTKADAKIKMNFKMDGIGGQGETLAGKPFILDGHNLYRYEAENTYSNTQIIGITDQLTDSLGFFKINNATYSLALNYPSSYFQTPYGATLVEEFILILSTFKFLGTDTGACQPTFPVETNAQEMTASQNYALECTLKKTAVDCLSVDIYNRQTKDFSQPDGEPDCRWTNSL
ncbi:MAG: hypothetical protein AAB430_01760 [Patescibacteria group bacterium]